MKKAIFVRLFVLVSTLCLLAACPDPSSPSGSSSTNAKVIRVFVSVNGGQTTIDLGGTAQFTAVVAVEGGAAKTVSWKLEAVSGDKSAETKIEAVAGSANQTALTVAADESALQLRITATSTVDASKSHFVDINVINPDNPPAVLSVLVTPEGETVNKGGQKTFTADVTVEHNAPASVTWVLEGNNSADTSLAAAASNPNQAILTVAEDESAVQLTITATAVFDTSKSHAATIQVTNPANPPVVVSVLVSPKNQTVNKGGHKTFTANVTIEHNAPASVTWLLEGNSSAGTSLAATSGVSNQAVLTVAGDESASALTITARATHINAGEAAGKFDSATVNVTNAAPLTKVSSVSLSEAGVATWTGESDDANVTKYAVQLYKSTASQGDAVEVTQGLSYSVNFLSAMRTAGTGSYTVTVTAIGDGTSYSDSDESEPSTARTVSQRTAVQYTWWHENDKARWVNPDGSGDYSVRLYKDGAALGEAVAVARSSDSNPSNSQETITTYDFATVKATNGIGQYSFRVIAKGDDALLLDAAETSNSGVTGYSPFGASRVWTIVKGGSVYVAGGDGGKIAYSSNGTTWTLATQTIFGETGAVRGIAHNGSNTFVAVGYNGKIATSPDGAAWTERTSGLDTSILCVAYGNGTFLAGGDGGEVRASTDGGVTWSEITGWAGSTICDGSAVLTLIFDGSKFVAGGENGKIAMSTTGTADWQWVLDVIGDSARSYKNFASGNGTIVLVLAGDAWLPRTADLLSNNGTTWAWSEHQVTGTIEGITFGGGKFLAFGGGGKVSSSSDNGENWTPITPGTAAGQTQFAARVDDEKPGDTVTAACFLDNGKFILGGPGRFAVITP